MKIHIHTFAIADNVFAAELSLVANGNLQIEKKNNYKLHNQKCNLSKEANENRLCS